MSILILTLFAAGISFYLGYSYGWAKRDTAQQRLDKLLKKKKS